MTPPQSPSIDLNFGDIVETRAIWNKSDNATFSARGLDQISIWSSSCAPVLSLAF